jgi:hypothetical protein
MKPDDEEDWVAALKPEDREVIDRAAKKVVVAMEGPYSDAICTEWRGEIWFNFHWIANEIVEQQGVSKGVAERTLRELCATGDVRSMKADGVNDQPEGAEIIRPSEWVKDQVDLTVSPPIWVFVSAFDAQYWLNKQAEASGRPSKELVPPRQRSARPRDIAGEVIEAIWPNRDIPKTVSNAQIEQQVGKRLKELGRSDISSDTILRAAGRK